jgi:hypothetical protein
VGLRDSHFRKRIRMVHISHARILQLNMPYLLLHHLFIHGLSHGSRRLDVSELRVHHNVVLLILKR